MNTIALDQPYYSSRFLGAQLRRDLVAKAALGAVVVDFSQVEGASDSFLDEAFGVPVLELGLQWLADNVRLANISERLLYSFAVVVAQRASERGEDPATTLAA